MENLEVVKNKIANLVRNHMYICISVVALLVILFIMYKYVPVAKMISGRGTNSLSDELDKLVSSIREKQKAFFAKPSAK